MAFLKTAATVIGAIVLALTGSVAAAVILAMIIFCILFVVYEGIELFSPGPHDYEHDMLKYMEDN